MLNLRVLVVDEDSAQSTRHRTRRWQCDPFFIAALLHVG